MAEIIDLSTTIERPTIRIDDVDYEMRHPEEFGIAELMYDIEKPRDRVYEILGSDEQQSKKVYEEADKKSAEVIRKIVPGMPEDVLERLHVIKRNRIMAVFTKLIVSMMRGETETPSNEETASAS